MEWERSAEERLLLLKGIGRDAGLTGSGISEATRHTAGDPAKGLRLCSPRQNYFHMPKTCLSSEWTGVRVCEAECLRVHQASSCVVGMEG